MNSCEVAAWAASGAMAISGAPAGPPLVAPGTPASTVAEHLAALGIGRPGLLGERAAIAGLRPNAPWSCGGAMRILRTSDGCSLALSLPRREDRDLVPALVEAVVGDEWTAVAHWSARTRGADTEARVQLLGLAGGLVRHRPSPAVEPAPSTPDLRGALVVDLTALWAGPLCGALLAELGARVVKVESRQRPDGARGGPTEFFDRLNGAKEHLLLDLPEELAQLRSLLASADLVLESSRPRAFRQFGIVAEEIVAGGTSWLSITARGRSSSTIGFGDDVAAAAGLVGRVEETLVPVGDALADPLTGVIAATRACAALSQSTPGLLDISMLEVSCSVLEETEPHEVSADGSGWQVSCPHGTFPVAPPEAS